MRHNDHLICPTVRALHVWGVRDLGVWDGVWMP